MAHHRHLLRDPASADYAITEIPWLYRPLNPILPTVFHCFGRKALLDDDRWLFRKNLISECAAIIVSTSCHSMSIPVFNFSMFHTVVSFSGSSLHSESFYLN